MSLLGLLESDNLKELCRNGDMDPSMAPSTLACVSHALNAWVGSLWTQYAHSSEMLWLLLMAEGARGTNVISPTPLYYGDPLLYFGLQFGEAGWRGAYSALGTYLGEMRLMGGISNTMVMLKMNPAAPADHPYDGIVVDLAMPAVQNVPRAHLRRITWIPNRKLERLRNAKRPRPVVSYCAQATVHSWCK